MKAKSCGSGRRLCMGLVVGSALTFGLTLQGTPPGLDGRAGDFFRVGGANAAGTVDGGGPGLAATDKRLPRTAPTNRASSRAGFSPNTDSGLRRARIISSVPTMAAGGSRTRDAIACDEPGASAMVGDPCLCDAECCGLTSDDGCVRGQCVNNRCAELDALLDSVCEVDGNWCALERCDGDGNCVPQHDGGGVCQPDGTNCLSPCPKLCDGGPNTSKWCERASDCPAGRCLITPAVSCNSVEQRCQVDARCDGGIDEGDPCVTDGDCSGSTCDGGLGRCCEYGPRTARGEAGGPVGGDALNGPTELNPPPFSGGEDVDPAAPVAPRADRFGSTRAAPVDGEVYDLVYVIDGSGSIDPIIFELQKEGVTNTICGPSAIVPPDGTVAVAVIQFSGQSALEVPLTVIDSPTTAESVCTAIGIIVQLAGTTHLAPALLFAQDIFTVDAAGVSRHLFISTDGSVADATESEGICEDLRTMTPTPVQICTALVGQSCPQDDPFLRRCANTNDSSTYDPSQPEGQYRCLETAYEYEQLVRNCTEVSPCAYKTQAQCNTDGGIWLRIGDSTERTHCWCPQYSSGVAPPGAAVFDVHPIVASGKVCALGGNRCEGIGSADCHDRCVGGVNVGRACVEDIDCPDSACVPDQCIQDVDACDTGFLSIGDDYAVHDGSYLRLREFRFHGGVENPGENIVFEFYDVSRTFVDAFTVELDEAGTRYWNLALDCHDDCDPFQGDSPRDPPFIIPPAGFVVMRSTRAEDPVSEANAHWVSTTSPPDVGTNNTQTLCVNGLVVDYENTDPDVLSFELVGQSIAEPLGACCRPEAARAYCTDTTRWNCGTCTTTGDPCSQVRDCGLIADTQLFCVYSEWFGPRSHTDIAGEQGELCANYECEDALGATTGDPCDPGNGDDDCIEIDPNWTCELQPTPCDLGACCNPGEGSCTVTAPETCEGAPANWLGPGTRCEPNCCPGPTRGEDCAYPTYQCQTGGECADGRHCSGSGEPCQGVDDCPFDETCDPAWTGTPCDPSAGEDNNPACDAGEKCLGHFSGQPCDPDHGDDDCNPGETCALRCAGPDYLPLALPGHSECHDAFGDPMGAPCDPANGHADCTAIDPFWLCIFALGEVEAHTFSGDSSPANFGAADGDTCSASSHDVGWYEGYTVTNPTGDPVYDCAVVTIDFCCTNPTKTPTWVALRAVDGEACTAVSPDTDESGLGRYGYGVGCGAEYCCEDGNFAATFTLSPGTYVWQVYGAATCEGTFQHCDAIGTDDDCDPGVVCLSNLGPYTGHFTVEPCALAACCVEDQCSRTSRLACEEAGGQWLGEGSINAVTDCFFAPCTTGSCCVGPGQCDDGAGYDNMADCLANGGADAIYVGGAACEDEPCPVCVFREGGACKEEDGDGIMAMSDRHVDARAADDFRPATNTIRRICWTPGFVGPDSECSDPGETPPDDWMVWVYPDDGDGVPDNDFPVAGPLSITIDAKVAHGGISRLWDYSGSLEEPVTVMEQDCYWLEITGKGTDSCNTYLATSLEGNRHSMYDVADQGTYTEADARSDDFVFCLDSGLFGTDDCGPILGTCCTCPGICQDARTRSSCLGDGGSWIQNAFCTPEMCPDYPANDDCGGAIPITGLGAGDVVLDIENVCAGDDGPSRGCGSGDFHFDIWYRYTAEACGLLTASMCDLAPFDTIMAFYDGSAGCPVVQADELRTCRDGTDGCCSDDTCGASAGPSELSLQMTFGQEILIRIGGWSDPLTGEGDSRGWGNIRFTLDQNCPPPKPPDPEPGGPLCTAGIRLCHGGPDEGQPCNTDADCAPIGYCWDDCWGSWSGANCVVYELATGAAKCYIPKNRYLTIDPTVNGDSVAYQVELTESEPYGTAVGRTWWVDTPICHDYPNGDPVPGATACEGPDYFGWVAKLTSTAVTRGWTETPVHLTDCGIVPVATYEIRASQDHGGNFSDAVTINTIHNPPGPEQSWGDVTGGLSTEGNWLPPEYSTNFGDIGSAIRTFENRSEGTGFPPRVWVDVEINQVVNLGDIWFVVRAFEGGAYAEIDLPLIGTHPALCP